MPNKIEIYQYIGSDSEYRKLGVANPAGSIKDHNVPPMVVYSCLKTGNLFFRTVEDFHQRMVKVWERDQ